MNIKFDKPLSEIDHVLQKGGFNLIMSAYNDYRVQFLYIRAASSRYNVT